mmetsp:Transcript_26319/g.51552  ORF Transcript_26319/g.51552 Transcript_26319/m.51552 type:complete len:144 (-) Transcript_26319:271-702(-)
MGTTGTTLAPVILPTTSTVTTTTTPAASGSSATFPFWGWILVLIGVFGVATLIYFLCSGDGKRKKSKKNKRKQSRDVEAEESAPVQSMLPQNVPLMTAAVPEPTVGTYPPPQGAVQYMPGMQGMRPMQQMQPTMFVQGMPRRP